MPFLEVEKLRVSDPLSEVTRRERKALLAVSAVGVAIVRTHLLPTKIVALGVDFSSTNQNALLNILALIIGYFVLAFLIYASSDFVAWRLGSFSLAYTSESEDYQRARQEVLSKLNLTPEQEEETAAP
ncbi:MAG TPA: hypothetical protein VNJ70_13470 [Thermoanaerobaculia bacterium]|nr:hypothetical protein [Thermoanaerobaculia bacterium]